MDNAVLLVADEANVLDALARLFLDRDVRVLRAGNGEEALGIVRREPVAVVVSDNLLPGMHGIELLSRVRDFSPDTVRVLLTGSADLPAATEAIHRGEVFRFHEKPWVDEEIVLTVEEGVQRYQVVRSLRHGDEAALRSIAQTIELKDPYTRGHCDRMAALALRIAVAMRLPERTQRAIKLGSWLHDCGKIGVPEAILNFPGKLPAAEFEVIKKHPGWGADIGRQANLPEEVVNIILYHHERFDGEGYPARLAGKAIPLASRIIAIAGAFDAMTSTTVYRNALPVADAIAEIRRCSGTQFDPDIIPAFLACLSKISSPAT